MMLNHRFLLIGFAVPFVVVALGSASAQSTRSFAATKRHHHEVQMRRPLYNTYLAPVAPVVPVVHPGCYLPSDGCSNEYSVQN
jgi:hypothetical protein